MVVTCNIVGYAESISSSGCRSASLQALQYSAPSWSIIAHHQVDAEEMLQELRPSGAAPHAAAAAAAVPPPSSPHGPRLPWGWRLPALPLPMAGAVHPGQPRHAAGHVPSPREAHAHAACKRGRCTAAEREKSAAAVGERRRAAGLPWRLPELQRLRWGSAWGAAPGAAAPTGA